MGRISPLKNDTLYFCILNHSLPFLVARLNELYKEAPTKAAGGAGKGKGKKGEATADEVKNTLTQ